jgi:methylase of polypeptide subunit release factors
MMASLSQSRQAAWLQNLVSQRREESGLYREVAEQLPHLDSGRVLDIGTGSGLMLRVGGDIMPHVELFGLDLSAAAIRMACRNLVGMEVDLRVGSLEQRTLRRPILRRRHVPVEHVLLAESGCLLRRDLPL